MKNYLLGFCFLIGAFYLIWDQSEQQKNSDDLTHSPQNPSINTSDLNFSSIRNEKNQSAIAINSIENPSPQSALTEAMEEKEDLFEGLQNEYSSLTFTSLWGGLRAIDLKKYDRLSKSFSMRQEGKPLLSIGFEKRDGSEINIFQNTKNFELNHSPESRTVSYSWVSSENIKITRKYWRDSNASYAIRHKTSIANLNNFPIQLDKVRLHLGSAFQIPRLYNPFDNSSTYLNVGYFNSGPDLAEGCSCAECSGRIDGKKEEFIQLNEMGTDGKMTPRLLSKAKWACVNNQFFVNLIRPLGEFSDVTVSGNSANIKERNSTEEILGVEGAITFPLGIIESNSTKELEFEVYLGPKDYKLLSELGAEQNKVMQFGIFWWVSEPLSYLLDLLSGIFGNYGIGIIVLTILVKLVLWPLTAQATRSQKKMQALQEPMGALREKHKGNPQKLNQEMMKFYKEHKVNPFAGCWPILIQIPIFLGMFWMLRSAAELYGQQFLWANDLSEQDHITDVYGFSANLLPILMVITQWFQMKLTPMQLGPQMSEAQRINAKMMRFMPFMFLIFLYFFSSALVLYWTVQNLMTIFQTLITKREPISQKSNKLENSKKSSSFERDSNEVPRLRNEQISDEERKHRNFLGLKLKGTYESEDLKRAYEERISNYTDAKLANMPTSKRQQALEKKEKAHKAYEFLSNLQSKET
jgi:YidC/Oxa1 family membrane protein insertase